MLQDAVIKSHRKELKLKVDVKTRWNNMAEMIRLFLELKDYLPGPLNELSYPGEFPTDGEIEKIVELSESLKVV